MYLVTRLRGLQILNQHQKKIMRIKQAGITTKSTKNRLPILTIDSLEA